MPRRNFLLALLGARLTFLIPDVGVLLLLGTLAFGMPIRGSLLLVLVIDVVGALAFAGIGLLIASRATSTETVSGLMNLVMLPMWLFSGVFFSAERFPDAAAAVHPDPAAHPVAQRAAGRDPRRDGLARRRPGLGDPRRLGRRHLPGRPADLPLDLSDRGRRRSGRRKTTATSGRPAAAAAASERRDVRPRRSVGRRRSPWPGSRRRGTPRPTAAGSPPASRGDGAGKASGRRAPARRRPAARAAGQASGPGRGEHRLPAADDVVAVIDRRRAGDRGAAAVQGSRAVVTRTSGAGGPFEPGAAPRSSACPSIGTTTLLDRASRSAISARSEPATAFGRGRQHRERARRPGRRRRAAGRAGSGPRRGRRTRRRTSTFGLPPISRLRAGCGASQRSTARGTPAGAAAMTGPGTPVGDGWPSIRTIERTSLVVPTRNTSSAADQLGQGHMGRGERDADLVAEPEDELPGRARAGYPCPSGVPSSRPPRTQRTEVCVASVTRPSSPTRTASKHPRGARPRWPGRWRSRFVDLHVAPLPAQVGMADRGHPVCAEPGGRSVVVGADHDQLGRRHGRVGKGVRPGRDAAGDVDVCRPLLDPARRDRPVHPGESGSRSTAGISISARLRRSRAMCSSSSQQRPW